MYKDNLNHLKARYPGTVRMLENANMENAQLEVIVEETKSHVPTIKAVTERHTMYIHSKYDPIKEAERIIQNYSNQINENTHVLFYGAGLAYHIELFAKLFPNTAFSIYEPSILMFKQLLSYRSFLNINLNNLKKIYLEDMETRVEEQLNDFASTIFSEVLLIPLPSYEKIFADQFEGFAKNFRNAIEARVYNLGVDYHFAKRWTLNALMNLPTTLSTPNFIEEKKQYFKDKPVLIVSAGPSLQDEYENLRYIKENGLAYIFSVGSANKALLANGILPDAVCTFDPQEHNFAVFRAFEEKGITTVPMIYGTSVGYETIQRYPGPKFHFITSQDTVSPYYLTNINKDNVINDAYSIAIITIDILSKLEVRSIILVGQNLAFKDNLFYSKEINRGKNKSAELQKKDLDDLVEVVDVYGNQIKSNSAFNQMRYLMEQYIEKNKQIEFINTTKGGANIEGAQFLPLEIVTTNMLKNRVVEESAFSVDGEIKTNNPVEVVETMNVSLSSFIKVCKEIYLILSELDELSRRNKVDRIQKVFTKLDNEIIKLLENDFFRVIIKPITRVQFELLEKSINRIKHIEDPIKKSVQISHFFKVYLDDCTKTNNEFAPIMKSVIHKQISAKESLNQLKRYESTSGEFHYSGGWIKEQIKIVKKKLKDEVVGNYLKTNEKNAAIKFKFNGSFLRVIGGKHGNHSSKIRIKIDGYTQSFSAKDSLLEESFVMDFEQVLFEKRGFSNGVHEVEITNLDERAFVFQGIELDVNGRLMHKDEVLEFDKLKVGERIRVNLSDEIVDGNAKVRNIGEETKPLIPLQSSNDFGDFYLIKVWVDGNEISKYVTKHNLGITKIKYKQNNELVLNQVPIMESNSLPNGQIISSSSYSSGNYNWSGFKAFNKKFKGITNAWATEKGVTNGWISYEFPNPVTLNSYTMVNQEKHKDYDTTKRMPKYWIVEGWNGQKWIELDKRTGISTWEDKVKKYFLFQNEEEYIIYRIVIFENNGDLDYLAIGEIEFN
ncbi:6-hydroxymethylpterin diphosphokinase MptE-like protein [Robertmurraya massiliosenegalensis]|uniref:motility associated factor glycosyltransferase family protein n=1 Tax=Robertmurraya TaxID=2837507 RepID=UPI0039A5C513